MGKPKLIKEVQNVKAPNCPDCKTQLSYIDPNEQPDGTYLMICAKCKKPFSMGIGKNYAAIEKEKEKQREKYNREQDKKKQQEKKQQEITRQLLEKQQEKQQEKIAKEEEIKARDRAIVEKAKREKEAKKTLKKK